MCLCRRLRILRNSAINPFAKTYSGNFDFKLQTHFIDAMRQFHAKRSHKSLPFIIIPCDLPLGKSRLSYFSENRLCFIELVRAFFVDSFPSYHIELICKHQKFIKNGIGIAGENGKDDDDERRSHATI